MATHADNCGTCRHWAVAERKMGDLDFGECRRNAPRPETGNAELVAYWPQTGATQWCGEFARLRNARAGDRPLI